MLYLSSSAIQKKRISDVLQICADCGIHNIEFSGGTEYYETLVDDLLQWKKRKNMNYVCHAYFPPPKHDFVINLASCNDEIYQRSLQHYMNCIDLLVKLNCSVLSLHAGFLVEVGIGQIGREITAEIIYDRSKAVDRFCSAYQKISKKAEENHIKVYLENNVLNVGNFQRFHHNNYFLMTDYDSIKEMKQELEFDLLLDLGHLYVSCHTLKLNYIEEVRSLKQYVKWLHLSENNGIIDEHRILTQESPIFQAFMELLDLEVNVTLEVKDSIENVKKNYEWIDQIINDKKNNKDDS